MSDQSPSTDLQAILREHEAIEAERAEQRKARREEEKKKARPNIALQSVYDAVLALTSDANRYPAWLRPDHEPDWERHLPRLANAIVEMRIAALESGRSASFFDVYPTDRRSPLRRGALVVMQNAMRGASEEQVLVQLRHIAAKDAKAREPWWDDFRVLAGDLLPGAAAPEVVPIVPGGAESPSAKADGPEALEKEELPEPLPVAETGSGGDKDGAQLKLITEMWEILYYNEQGWFPAKGNQWISWLAGACADSGVSVEPLLPVGAPGVAG
jgi:hypothetical protein